MVALRFIVGIVTISLVISCANSSILDRIQKLLGQECEAEIKTLDSQMEKCHNENFIIHGIFQKIIAKIKEVSKPSKSNSKPASISSVDFKSLIDSFKIGIYSFKTFEEDLNYCIRIPLRWKCMKPPKSIIVQWLLDDVLLKLIGKFSATLKSQINSTPDKELTNKLVAISANIINNVTGCFHDIELLNPCIAIENGIDCVHKLYMDEIEKSSKKKDISALKKNTIDMLGYFEEFIDC